MKKITLYYATFHKEMEIPDSSYKLLMRNWKDRSSRGETTTVQTVRGTQYDIDLSYVQLIETESTKHHV